MQRLALCAGLCCLGWLALESLDHDAARADDPPAAEQPSDGQPRGLPDLVGDVVDAVLPDPPAGEDNGRGSDDEPAEDEPADDSDQDNGRGGDDPPAEQPREDDEDEPATPIRDVVEDVVEIITPDPPEPVDGDDGRPQHPVDTPPAPDPTPVIETPAELPPATDPVELEQPAPGELDSPTFGGPPFGGLGPAPWTSYLDTHDSQIGRRTGGSVCDSQGDGGGTGRGGRPGATRDRLTLPRGLVGPGLVPLGAPCQPDNGTGFYDLQVPATTSNPADPGAVATAAGGYVLTVELRGMGRTLRDDTALPGRLTLWPPGPG